MNTINALSYQKSFQLFKKNQKSLPQKIRWKLNYITTIIQGKTNQINQNLPEQYQLEINDLKDVNNKGLQIIFVSIVQTLFNQQIPIDKQCSIRKKGFFKSWHDCFIKYDDTYIYLNSQNKTSRYKLKNVDLRLSSNSKRSFDFLYKGHLIMTIKFQKPESMMAMYKTIKILIINQKNKYDLQMKEKLAKGYNKNDILKNKDQKKLINSYYEDPIMQKTFNHGWNIKSNKSQEQIKFKSLQKKNSSKLQKQKIQMAKSTLMQSLKGQKTQNDKKVQKKLQFERASLSKQQTEIIIRNPKDSFDQVRQLKLGHPSEDFQIKNSSKKMFLALHNKEIKLNLQLIFELQAQISVCQIMSCLALYLNWNSKVLKQKICFKKNLQQKVIIYRVYQKINSLLSKYRQTYTMLQYTKINQTTAILLQQSLQNQDRQEQFIRAYLKTVFFVQIQDKTIKISIQSQFDPKGFCSFAESQQLLTLIYKDIAHFQNFINQYCIKNQKNSQTILFVEQQTEQKDDEIQQKQQNDDYYLSKSINMDLLGQKSSDEEQKRDNKLSLQIYRRSCKRDPFFQLKPDNPLKIPTLEYLQLIVKKQFQKYYLNKKHLIKVQPIYEDYIPWYCLEELLKKGGQYEVTQKLELRFINQKLIQSQKDILRFILRQIGANIISGKSVLNVSLPVDIFQSRTLLQRSAASLGKCPDYLLGVAQSDPLEQMMHVTAFLATLPTLELVMQKPFNPILGQTFQCYLKGIPLCYEQISHHPPVSSYYMECKQFKIYGNLIAFADVGLNSGVGGNLGVMHIVFKNKYHYQCYFPPSQISGLIYGDRKFRSYGRGYILQRSQNIFSQFSIQKAKKGIYQTKDKLLPGSIIGGIFKVNTKFIQYLDSFQNNLKKFSGISKQHIVQKLISISGIWFDKIYMNDKNITQGKRAYPVQYYPYSLPSDANFRLDVLYHKQNNLPQSQKQKQVLQNIQREDRKQRQKFSKLIKKK